MPRLIVNADDLGAGTETDRGIFEAFRRGIVSSASLLASGASSPSAALGAWEIGLPVGVHLNLSEGVALSGPIRGLTDESGRFPGKAALRAILQQSRVASSALRCELAAQIDRARQLGIVPDHLDTHQHCLLFPQVRQIVIELAKSEGIRALRLPAPAEPPGDDPPTPLGDEVRLYRQQADDLRRALLESGLRHPQGLLGMPWLNRLDDAGLAQLLRNLPAGDWELMVHPGYPDPQNPFSGAQRLQELQALTNPAIRSLCAERAITLISFAEL